MRPFLVIVVLFVAGLGALAASMREADVDAPVAPPIEAKPLTAAELRWIRGYARWTIAIHDHGLRSSRRGPLRDCAAVLRVDAGPPPTRRLRPAAARVERACTAVAAGRSEDVIDGHLARADEELAPLLLTSKRLPSSPGASVDSRRSPALEAIAGELGDDDIEVRCRSERDWRRVIREEAAWTDSADEPHLIDGLADVSMGRIELRLEDCNLLERLVGERVGARSREGLIAAADALATLSHEIQHFRLPDASEAEVECAGADELDVVGRALGVDGRENDLLYDVYVESVRPQLADEYLEDC